MSEPAPLPPRSAPIFPGFAPTPGVAATHVWSTPRGLYDALDEEFGFTLDAACDDDNCKCRYGWTEKEDGLVQPWFDAMVSWGVNPHVWCNPPYGRGIGDWIRKGYKESQKGAVVVMLVFARTDTAWFHDWGMKADEIRFIRGRLKFGNATNSAPAPSMLLVFRPGSSGPPEASTYDPKRT